MSRRIRVLVVDDSTLLRRAMCDILGEAGDVDVIGEASDGWDALAQVHALRPDVVTLDIDMPSLGGLDALGYIMSESPRPVVVVSALDSVAGHDVVIRALELGAVDVVRKPRLAAALDTDTLRRRLVEAVRGAGGVRASTLVPYVAPPRAWRNRPEPMPTVKPNDLAREVVVIAASTGGPKTLAEIVPRIPSVIGAAIVVVQHMPEGFTASLAARLHDLGPRPAAEARHGELLLAGRVYVAPGGHQLTFRPSEGGVRQEVSVGQAAIPLRPCADVTLSSAAECFGSWATAVVLTGMGRDGAAGAQSIFARGGRVLVQHPESCVVSGMVQAVLALGIGAKQVPIAEFPAALVHAYKPSRHGQPSSEIA